MSVSVCVCVCESLSVCVCVCRLRHNHCGYWQVWPHGSPATPPGERASRLGRPNMCRCPTCQVDRGVQAGTASRLSPEQQGDQGQELIVGEVGRNKETDPGAHLPLMDSSGCFKVDSIWM